MVEKQSLTLKVKAVPFCTAVWEAHHFSDVRFHSPTIKQLFNKSEWDEIIKVITEFQFASALSINESVTNSIVVSLLNSLCLEIELKDKKQSSELNDDFNHIFKEDDLQSVAKFIEKWLPIIKENDVPDGIIKTLEIIQCLIEHREEIDSDSTGEIKGVDAQSDCGGPLLNYSHLNIVNGDGTYISYNIAENKWDSNNDSSAFERWAKDHGYYDGDYATDLYWVDEEKSIYDEIADSYQEVHSVHVKNGVAVDSK